jgi:dipeptidyl-peptidase-4
MRTHLLSAVAATLFAFVPAPAQIAGQEPLANQRANPSPAFTEQTRAMQSRWANLVLNANIAPEWLDDNRLIYRLDEPGGRWRFVICNAQTGEVAPAFDHALIAAQLSGYLARDVDLTKIPFARLAAGSDNTLLAMLSPDAATNAPWPVVRLSSSEVTADHEPPASFVARRVRDRASGNGPATYLLIRNSTPSPVRLFWLESDGNARAYETIDAGASRVRTTFAGHVWSIRDGDNELARVVADPRPTILDVSASVPHSPDEAAPPEANREAPEDPAPVLPRVAFRNGNIIITDSTGERPLTTDGTADHGFSGPAWLSPDASRFVVMKTKKVTRQRVHIIESRPDDQVQPKLHSFAYPKPGDPIDEVLPWLFDISTGQGRPLDTSLIPTPWSLTRAHWVDSSRFRLLYNERGHAVVRIVEFNAADNSTRTFIEESSNTFVDYPHKVYYHLLRDGRVLWMSQRTGWNHLYLLDGERGDVIRPLTHGDWLVRSVEHIDEDAGTLLLRVLGIHADQDPYHHHFIRVDLNSGAHTILTDGDGTHEIERSPDGHYYIARFQRVDLPPVTELRRWQDGTRLATLAAANASELFSRGWRPPERFVAKGRDQTTDIWGVIFLPTDFDPARKYAVIENIYAGPHGHFVPKDWSVWHGHRELAERGFIVVQIDGMGTNWRSKAFHDIAHKNLGDSGFPDRIAWLRAAAQTRPFMDLARVGIYGGSAGGQSSTRALLAHPHFYTAAVSDCGCHDNRVDKMWWNELWMGYPIGPHYEDQSNVTQAGNLKGNLLLIVGALDRNVDPASTMQVVDALIDADKDFELLVIPDAGHGAAESPYGRRRRAEFFQRVLGPPTAIHHIDGQPQTTGSLSN